MEKSMIRKCDDSDFNTIYEIINEAAQVYRGIIPADRWKEPTNSDTRSMPTSGFGVMKKTVSCSASWVFKMYWT